MGERMRQPGVARGLGTVAGHQGGEVPGLGSRGQHPRGVDPVPQHEELEVGHLGCHPPLAQVGSELDQRHAEAHLELRQQVRVGRAEQGPDGVGLVVVGIERVFAGRAQDRR